MARATETDFTAEEVKQLRQFRESVAKFKDIVTSLPADQRSPEHNQQFNQLRLEAKELLKGSFTTDVPRAITGDVTTDRSISVIVVAGVILALLGLGVNSIILEDVIINSLGCVVSSGGMLLVIGGFVVLNLKNMRQRVSNMDGLRQRCELLLYQVDHRLHMIETEFESNPGSVAKPSVEA